jgi:hypothetical protein
MKRLGFLICVVSTAALLATNGVALQKGMSLASYWHDQYSYPESDSSIVALSQTGVDWISILTTWYQDSIGSTVIYRDRHQTPDDSSLMYMIDRAHELGLKVMLKPHVDIQDETWRAMIEFDNEADWHAWFSSYTAFITHYADLAQDKGVEQFCVGCELTGTIHRKVDWENVIDDIRSIYDGPLTYAANYWPAYENVPFWDALDYIGIDAYFGLTQVYDPTLSELVQAWDPWVDEMEDFSETMNKPIVITEIGYRSIDGCNIEPWDWWSHGEIDLEEQELCYAAACSVMLHSDWLGGLYFWSWEVDRPGGPDDDGYTPRGKPAEDVMKDWFAPDSMTAVVDGGQVSRNSLLLHTYPVPFRNRSYVNAGPGAVRVYDSAGRLVRVLVTETDICCWDGTDNRGSPLKSGVYIYRTADRVAKTVYLAE